MGVTRYGQLFLLTVALLLLVLSATCGDKSSGIGTGITEWTVSSPETQNLDPRLLAELRLKLQTGEFGEVSSMLIVRNGKLVFEEYFRGMNAQKFHQVYSVSKSVTSMLVGIAVDEGDISTLDTSLLDYFPQYSYIANWHTKKDSVTLEHVLQMRAGLEWDELGIPYSNPANPYRLMVRSSDMFKFVLDLPLVVEPGTEFAYNTGATVLLAGILERATGQDAETYAAENLFAPLGITEWTWERGPGNVLLTGSGLYLRPRDMAKLGLLYLNAGAWEGTQVVSSGWIEQSIQPYSDFGNGSGYGYQWWLMTVWIHGVDTQIPHAIGYGNQYIFFIRPLNMVVVATGEHYQDLGSHIGEIIRDYVVPAALKTP